ncbi:hypothetical protein M3Y97_01110600 [Aphelenchoides bicaudatus]|nr:hypothetical protein M3Y97_01110600 [Aphelenchoides bicaudatus]
MIVTQSCFSNSLGVLKNEFADSKVFNFLLRHDFAQNSSRAQKMWNTQKATLIQKYTQQSLKEVSKKCCASTLKWQKNLNDFWLMADANDVLKQAVLIFRENMEEHQLATFMDNELKERQCTANREVSIQSLVSAIACRAFYQNSSRKAFEGVQLSQIVRDSFNEAKQICFKGIKRLRVYNDAISVYYELLRIEIDRITDEKLETQSNICCKVQLISQFIKMDI